MSTDTRTYKGYTIKIEQDQDAENPFESWDCEPPMLTYSGGRHGRTKAYGGAPENWWDVLRLLPADTWTRGKRVEFLKEFILPLGVPLRVYAEEVRRVGDLDACAELLGEHVGRERGNWGSACTWFELAESLLKWGGIACDYQESSGYSQGDSTLCLVVLTPEWYQLTGAPPENAAKDCQNAIDLYGAWAWGDVYGVSEITAPGPLDEDGDETEEGEELEEGSCWGFYGSDHEKSGLMEHARAIIDGHIQDQAREAEDLESALCSAE